MYHYSSPPPGWSAYDYTTSPTSPHYGYYSPQHGGSPRVKRHSHRASYSASKDSGYSSYGYYDGGADYTPSRKYEHVSPTYGGGDYRSKGWKAHRRSSMPNEEYLHYPTHTASSPLRSQKRPPVFWDEVDDAFESPDYTPYARYESRAGPTFSEARTSYQSNLRRAYRQAQRKTKAATDQYCYSFQVPAYDEPDSPRRSRARRASTSTRTPQKPRPVPTPKPAPKATVEDAIREGIPDGYSIKNWDPTEAPILLLGSVFDANSLGKWIYDWTVYYHGAATPMAEVAGDLWLLLIKLAGKVKRAEECGPRIRSMDAREMVEDFLDSGNRLWMRFKKLLKACEHFMYKAAKRDPAKGTVQMGRNAGCEFVDSIFGRDRELENTEKLMNAIRMWNMRFDANCEEILRRPGAA
ncbi:hypothetical protein AJ80_05189 [Polytolypa hystricis UAMH7299]|uniref:Vegetative cell wall protein gp1 n=1 Tax=Polytolypa hystricis (strain UAMH7299) TaxID=1447883 RepID=A0A2B7XXJ3_POLH7|nr:hypothetical protein AJ80_05189 [Polytolypa hystricis UAMH7299]